MTIVKAAAASGIRRIPGSIADRSTVPVEPSPSERRIADLTAELAKAREALAAFRDEADAEIAAARIEGAREVKRDDEARIADLRKGIDEALAGWHGRLQELEALALLLAKQSLAKLFADSADLADLVARTLARKIDEIGAEAIVRVRVSASDFPDSDSLGALADRCGLPRAAIVADLPESGDCRIDLALGQADLSLPAQWSVIRRRLEVIAAEADT